MVKNKNKKNEKYVRLGTSFENCFVLYNRAVLWHQTNTKLLVVAFLYDDDILSRGTISVHNVVA